MRTLAISTVLAITGLGFLASCGESEAAVTPPPPAPEKQTLGEIGNLSFTEGFYLAGQPTEADIALLKEQGVKTVIDLRMPEEDRGFDEAKVVADAGISYIPVPFSSGDLSDAIIDQLRGLLNDSQNQPVLVHCGGANRVGAIWLAYRALDDGLSEEDALAEAKAVGLSSESMEQIALEYVRKNKEK